jgi:hypothetical protein
MKKIVEVENEGMMALIGERITVYCINYIYTGTLEGVNKDCILLTRPSIVYDTGAHDKKEWADAQPLPNDLYVMLSAVESFGIMK